MEGNTCTLEAGLTTEEVERLLNITGKKKVTIEAVEAMEEKLAVANLSFLKKKKAQMLILKEQSEHPEGVKIGAQDMMTRSRNEKSGNVGLEGRARSVIGVYDSIMSDFMIKMRPKTLQLMKSMLGGSRQNVEQKEVARNVVKNIQDGDNSVPFEAQEMAGSYVKVVKLLMARMSDATGIPIHFMADMTVPQSHNAAKINAVKYEEWKAFTLARLDRDKMGIADLADDKVDEIIESAYHNARTDGGYYLNQGIGKGGVAGKYSKERFFHFKNGDAWLEYQDKFGTDNLYQVMMNHTRRLARDVATVERFGNDPQQTLDMMKVAMIRGGFEKKDFVMTQSLFDIASGNNNTEGGKIASTLATVKDLNVATTMGSAMLAAAADAPLTMLTAKMNAVPVFDPAKLYIKDLVGQINAPKLAGRMGLMLDFTIDRGGAANNGMKDLGSDAIHSGAEIVMRASYLEAHTVRSRSTFAISLVDSITQDIGKKFDELPKFRKERFKQHGIDEVTWDKMRKSEMTEEQGHSFVDPLKMDIDTQAKFVGMMHEEVNLAVTTVDNFEQSLLSLKQKHGSDSEAVMSAITQFKSMPLYMITSQLARARAHGLKGGTAYAAAAFIGTASVAMLSSQLRQIATGKEPYDWDDPKLLIEAFRYSALGNVVTDFMLNNSGIGYSVPTAEFLAGPTVGRVAEIFELLTFANGQKLMEGDYQGFSEKLVKIAQKNKIGQNIWWSRLALERLVFDQINQLINPNWKYKAQKRMRKYGVKQYWKSGELLPEVAK